MNNRQYANIYIKEGNSRFDRGKFKKAAGSYRMALLYDPDNVAAHINLGLAFWRDNKLETAFKEMKKAILINPLNKKTVDYIEALQGEISRKKTLSGKNRGLGGFLAMFKTKRSGGFLGG